MWIIKWIKKNDRCSRLIIKHERKKIMKKLNDDCYYENQIDHDRK